MMKLLWVAVLLAGCTLGATFRARAPRALLGASSCTWGPSYWCDNIRKSSECEATGYCIDGTWSSLQLPPDHDDVCHICLDMVQQARDTLRNNQTQEELREVLEGSCNLIPVKMVAKECDTLVDDFIPELVEILSSEMDPQVVCHTAGLCNSEHVDQLLAEQQQQQQQIYQLQQATRSQQLQQQQEATCTSCRDSSDRMKTHVSEAGRHDLIGRLLPLCRELGSLSDACVADVVDHVDLFHQLLVSIDSLGLCQVSALCPGFHSAQSLGVLDTSSPAIDCDFCIHVVKHWRDIMVANTTREEFKKILDGICHKSDHQKECMDLVDRYFDVIYEYLVNDMQPHSLCQAVGLCSTPPQDVKPLWANVVAGSSSERVLKSLKPLLSSPGTPESVPMVELFRPTVTEQDLNSRTLHRVSLKKTPTLSSAPAAAVSFGDDGIARPNPLDKDHRPEDVELVQLPLRRMMLPDVGAILRPNAELCALCEFSLEELQKVLLNDSTEDEIARAVENSCHLLPSVLVHQCRHYVSMYGEFVITLLAEQINAHQICPALNVCPTPALPGEQLDNERLLQATIDGAAHTPGCVMCEYGMHALLGYLEQHKTAEEIRDGLDVLCVDLLPRSVEKECRELVNTFAEQIIDYIVSGMTADEVCRALQLCLTTPHPDVNKLPGVRSSPPLSSVSQRGDGEVDGSLCVVCQFVIDQLKEKLDDDKTDDEILAEVSGLCEHVPHAWQGECRQLVADYGRALLVELRSEVDDPGHVCHELKLCPAEEDEHEPAILAGANHHLLDVTL